METTNKSHSHFASALAILRSRNADENRPQRLQASGNAGAKPLIDRFLIIAVLVFVSVHLLILFLLPDLEARFQLGDRAWARAIKIDALLAATTFDGMLRAVFYHDNPGDYILFAPMFAWFGTTGVILQNVALSLAALVFLYRIGSEFFSRRIAQLAVVAWLVMPATLFHPHTLSSEALCNPLLIIATFYALRLCFGHGSDLANVLLLSACLALLIFVRPIYLLLPFVIAGFWILVRQPLSDTGRSVRHVAALLAVLFAISYSLTAAWSFAGFLNNGRYEVSQTFEGLNSNLFMRAERMAKAHDVVLARDVLDKKLMKLDDFVRLAVEHPVRFTSTIVSDVVNLVGNTGVNMVYGRFFGVFSLAEANDEAMFVWRDIRDKQGLLAVLVHLGKTSPAGLATNLAAVAIWAVILLLAAYGALRLWLQGGRCRIVLGLLLAVTAYLFVFTFVSGSPRWDHRAPIEFIIALLFAVGATRTYAHWSERHSI